MSSGISRISYCSHVTLVTFASLPCSSAAIADVLSTFSNAGVNVDMISQTAPQGGAIRLSFTVSDEVLSTALPLMGVLKQRYPDCTTELLPGNGKLAFYDPDMVRTPGVAANVFSLLSQAGIQIMLITTSDVDISLLVNEHEMDRAGDILRTAYGIDLVEATL